MKYPHMQHVCNLTRGGDVLYVGSTGHGVQHFIKSVADLNIEGVTTRRSKGHELVTFPDGHRLHFATLRTINKARGLTVQHIVIDDHTMLDDPDFRATLRPCFSHPYGVDIERYSVIG
ncbi:hypothetical protein ACFSWE_08550 [Leucobacter albus]|uniref:Uncharacterized protein n=1 Tax=Leucobacter albus TaxID=272210 RepID=A0ABW3TQS6_9MICO